MKLASTDPLTGILNRREFFKRGQTEISRCSRYKAPLSILLIDIDNLKEINDKYGHAAGDKVLIKLVETLLNQIRNTDVPGRLGGEEFGILIPGTGIDDACLLAERMHKNVENPAIPGASGKMKITISIGVNFFSDDDGNFDSLIAGADTAMYQAKRNGRNKSEKYTE